MRQIEAVHAAALQRQKVRQAIHENAPELRALEQKLNAAYTNKQRYIQVQEKKLIAQSEALDTEALNREMREALAKAERDAEAAQLAKLKQAATYKGALNNQLQEGEERKRQEYASFLKEKALIDEIVRAINDENERETRSRIEKQKETQQYVRDFMVEREEWKKRELARQEAENAQIAAYAQQQAEREASILGDKRAAQEAQSAIYDRLASAQNEQLRAKLELEDLRNDLAQEEQEAAARAREQAAFRDRVRKRLELVDAYQAQVAFKAAALEEERLREDAYRAEVPLSCSQSLFIYT